MGLMTELKRRGVLRMVALYVVTAWLVMQVGEVLVGLVNLPEWVGPAILAMLAVGFPIALGFSWFYELTPGGLALEKDIDRTEPLRQATGRRMDFVIIAILLAAVMLFAWDKWWVGPPPELSIAVLPFENMSGDPDQEYFSDGISEELLNVLAQYPGLHVAARTSSFQFKNRTQSIAEIAAALNVANILEGSVRRSGDRLRITAQLVNAADGYHLWSDTFDRKLDDIFAVQDEIAGEIGAVLKVKLAAANGEIGPEQPSITRAASLDAYDLYLEGRELVHLRDPASLEAAIRLLERALRLDANYAPAHAQLAVATILQVQVGASTVEDARLTATPHLDRAGELEPDLVELHHGRALLASLELKPESTIEHARRALALNPSYIDALTVMGGALERLGRYAESDAAVEQVVAIDPLNVIGLVNYIERMNLTGRNDEAHDLADRLVTQSPGWGYERHAYTSALYQGKIADGLEWALKSGREGGGYGLARAFLMWIGEFEEARRLGEDLWLDMEEGHTEDAIRKTERNLTRDPERVSNLTSAGLVLYFAGRFDEAVPLLEQALDLSPENRPIAFHLDHLATMALADARRRTGDEAGAQAVAAIVREDHAARIAAGRRNENQDIWGALVAAFDNDVDGAIAYLQSAVQQGVRDKGVFDLVIFENLRDDPRFIALQKQLDAILAAEHEKVLQLICFNNPVADDWRPLPETCEGIPERPL